jgi:hypothetical protein
LTDSHFPFIIRVLHLSFPFLTFPFSIFFSQQGRTYDPIFYASTQRQNAVPQTIFSERGLALVAVSWPWAIALKLVRYAKQDPVDCAAFLRRRVSQRGIGWTVAGLEQWIAERCWPMVFWVSATAEAAAASATAGCACARVSDGVFAWPAGGIPDDESDVAVFLVTSMMKRSSVHDPTLQVHPPPFNATQSN